MRHVRLGEYASLNSIDDIGSLKKKLKKIAKKVVTPIKKVVKKAATIHRAVAAKLAPKPLKKLLAPKQKSSSSSAAPGQVVEEVVYTDANGNVITREQYEQLILQQQTETYQAPPPITYQSAPPAYQGPSYEASAPPASYYDAYDAQQSAEEPYPELAPEGGEDQYSEASEDITPVKQLTQDPATTSPVAPSGFRVNPYVVAGGVAILGVAGYFLFLRKPKKT